MSVHFSVRMADSGIGLGILMLVEKGDSKRKHKAQKSDVRKFKGTAWLCSYFMTTHVPTTKHFEVK